MVTIDILKESQRTRPRHWIVNFGWIFIWPMIVCLLILLCNVIPEFFLIAELNRWKITLFGTTYTMSYFLSILIVPAALWVVGLFPATLAMKMGKYRHPYYLLSIPAVFAMVAYPLTVLFLDLHSFVPGFGAFLDRYIPTEVFALIQTIVNYVGVGLAIWLILVCFFAIIYNVNYPGKYEEIYRKRKQRLLSYEDFEDRYAYRKRFYKDYKKGNWESMMFDLHFAAIADDSTEPIPEDAYEFMRMINGRNEDAIRSAILDQYYEEGRYGDIRRFFHKNVALNDIIDNGARIHLGPRPKRKETIPPYVPPLDHKDEKRSDPKDKLWSPDDI